MAGIDASIISGLKVPQPHALETVGKLQEVQRGILGNRQLSQEIGATEAQGRAVTKNTKDGVTDWDGAANDLSLDPAGAWKAGDFAAQVLKRKSDQIALETAKAGLTQAELATSQKKFAAVGDWAAMMAAAGAKDPSALADPKALIASAGTGLINTGIINPANQQERDQFLSVMAQFGNDPKKNLEILKQTYLQGHATSEGIGLVLGPLSHNGLSVSEATTPTPVMVRNPDGTLTLSNITREQFVDQSKAGPVAASAPLSKSGLSAQDLAKTVTITDQVTKKPKVVTLGSLLGEDVPGGQSGGAVPAIKAGGVEVGLAPGQAEAAVGKAAENVAQAAALQRRASIVPDRRAALSEMVGTLDHFTPGPKADLTGMINRLQTQFGVRADGPVKGAAAQDTFEKLAAQIATQQFASLGGTGANQQLQTVMTANPNKYMSEQGIKSVAALLQGNEDAIEVQNQAWNKFQKLHGPESFGDFMDGWNRYYDPRVFQSQHMSPAETRDMRNKMNAKEREHYDLNLAVAKKAGWIK